MAGRLSIWLAAVFLMACAGLGLGGCRPQGGPDTIPPLRAPLANASGTLDLTIRWPESESGTQRVQVLPASTSS
jgi:hypothetical protein